MNFRLFLPLVLALTSLRAAPAETLVAPASGEIFAAAAGEPKLFESLRGVRLIAQDAQVAAPGFPADGLDTALVPELPRADLATVVAVFIDQPASQASLNRLVGALRTCLRLTGRPFATVYLPPQDVTGGYVQIVIAEARAEGAVTVLGARYFSRASYQAQFRQQAGALIDARQLADDVAWLNRNSYRRAVVSAQAGAAPGTTNLVVRTDERWPFSFNTGYSNAGTPLTGKDRVSAGLTWGNAFGRGDLLSLGGSGDPAWEHMRSWNAGYTAFLPWRHVLSLQAAHSTVESVMPEPFTQQGTSWQVGARYEVPLKAPRAGWTQNLEFTADFKYSDNTLEFATIPITGNVTHVVQFGATYALARRSGAQSLGLSASLYASPGGLTSHNQDAFFDGSRAGATADYCYGRIDANYSRQLPQGFSVNSTLSLQAGSGELLGSEQLNGGGSSAVRGYAESSAFGDGGAVWLNELHLPGFSPTKTGDRLAPFVFADAASLYTLGLGGGDTHLASAGAGFNYQWRQTFSLRAVYGWQLKDIGGTGHGRAHVSASMSW